MRTTSRLLSLLLAAAGLTAGCAGPEMECAHCSTAAEENTAVSSNGIFGEPAAAEPLSSYVTDWIPPANRKVVPDFSFVNQDGSKTRLSDFRGAPVALSFIYTRCQNQRKCPLAAKTMATLQAALEKQPVVPAPALALITYDPEFDTPARLKSFGESHALRSTAHVMLLRPEPAAKEQLFRNLNVRVNFNAQGVNLHGIQLILLDKLGRYVRTYHTLIWNNAEVLADLSRLAKD